MRMAQKKMTPKRERSPMEEHLWKNGFGWESYRNSGTR
jgi:hypothetical protein